MPKGMGVDVYAVSTDVFQPQGMARYQRKIGKAARILVTRTMSRAISDVLREGVGYLADRATFVDPDGVIQIMEQTREAWAVRQRTQSASRPPSTFAPTRPGLLRQHGKKAATSLAPFARLQPALLTPGCL
jgi:hypothetical protein